MKSLPVPGGAARALIDAEADVAPSHSPDGIDLFEVNIARWSVAADHRRRPPATPTAALLDGSAAERRRRREEQRAVAGLASLAPPEQPDVASDGEEAA